VLFLAALPELRTYASVLAVSFIYQITHIRGRAAEYEAQIKIEHALLVSRAEIERLASRDALTGLSNRRAYESVFPAQWHQAARQKTSLALIVMDLDHFKRVNDTLGHAAGDAALVHVARLLERHFRRGADSVARIGGEEFVVIMPDTSVDEALRLATAFRAALNEQPLVYDQQSVALTASMGVGVADWDCDKSPENTFKRIDAACYSAKASGRNLIIPA